MRAEMIASAEHIRFLADADRVEARKRYRASFDVAIDDPAIDEELHLVARWHDFDKGDRIAVPARLVLALILRPRGKGEGRKRPPQERWTRRLNDRVVRQANLYWAEFVDEDKEDRKKAKRNAAQKAYNEFRRGAIQPIILPGTIKKRMRIGAGRRYREARRRYLEARRRDLDTP
jgi:hypothetical protein